MAPRYKPGAATAAALKAAHRARFEAEKAEKAASKSSTASLRPPSPSGSRHLRPRSPQVTRTDPGFVSQPRDSRISVVSPLRQSSTSQNAIEVPDDEPTSDEGDVDGSSTPESSDDEGEVSSSAESTASRPGGKRKKKRRKVSKKKKGKAVKGKGRAKSKKKRSQVPKALVKVVDNDSDIEMISNPKKNKPGQDKHTVDGPVFNYYGEPEWDSDNPDDEEPKLYPCNWCGKFYRDGQTNHFNLKGHRDGAIGRKPCASRDKAISAGLKLPPTYQEEEAAKKAAEKSKGSKTSLLDMFLEIPKFTVRLLNCMLVLWLVRQALPWNRMADPMLIAAFQFANPSAILYTPAWAAREAMKIYEGVHNDVIQRLQNLPGKFCLIHDVWTTKRGRRAFIGVSVSYIDKNWKFHVHHLTLKLVAWNHYGALLARPIGRFLIRHKLHKKMIAQTTDSGGTNNLTAKELEDMFQSADDSVYWDSSRHQIRCYAHKLALTVKAGLASIKVKSGVCKPTAPSGRKLALLLPDLPKNQKPLPTIVLNDGEAIEDVDEDLEEAEDNDLEKCAGDDESEIDDQDNDDTEEVEDTEIASGDSFSKAIHKCSKVNKIIARNGPLMQLFHAIAKEEAYTGPGLIAAHGQRWNIFLDMIERLMKAKKIVNRMLNEDEDNMFDGVFISPEDWKMVEALSNVLTIFYSSTKCMEGDAPNAGSVLFQYTTIIGALKDIKSNTYPQLASMIRLMITRLEDYQEEAIHCHAIIMATMLNPKFRGKFFDKLYPERSESAHDVLKNVYEDLLQDRPPATSPTSKAAEPTEPTPPNIFKERNIFASQTEAEQPGDAELQAYLSGKYMCDDNQDILDWWACHERHFPNLAVLARDYLCCVGTSCACERTFSAAADVITADRGGLASRTIERAVGLCEWLKKRFVPPGDYGEAMRIAEKIMGRQKKGKKTL